jgi:hypothetical protein
VSWPNAGATAVTKTTRRHATDIFMSVSLSWLD